MRLLLSVKEAAEAAGIGRTFAYELIHAGIWPHVMVGTKLRVPVGELEAWITANTLGGTTASIANTTANRANTSEHQRTKKGK